MIPSLWLWAGFAFLLLARSTKQRIRAKYILIPGAIMVSQAWVLYFFYYPIANIFDAIFAEFDFYAHGMLYREALLLPVVFLVYTWFFCIWGRQTLPAVGLALFPAVRCVIYALLLWIFVVDEWSFWVNEWIGAISLLLPALLAKLAVRRAKKPSHAAEG